MQWTTLRAVDLSWVKSATDPLEVLGHGLDFLEDPSKINSNNREMWCNLHLTPALGGIIVEVHSLEEVTYWAKKGHLGSDSEPYGAWCSQFNCSIWHQPLAPHPQFGQGACCPKSENVFHNEGHRVSQGTF